MSSSPGTSTKHGSILRLPYQMADFARRGFRTDRPASREVLELHARSFLTGFNIAVKHWRDPHDALAGIPPEERGFAYEGAGMFAGLLDLLTVGRARALKRLLSGTGDDYTHLVHVGAGWLFTVMRLPALPRLPETPLLRWLAADGSGFGEVYFGGERALLRRAAREPGEVWAARLGGCGRALWFVQSGHPAGVAAVIARLPEAAQPHVWSGIGLASAYAGALDEAGRTELLERSGKHRLHFAQGIVFAAGARVRSTIVPQHTEDACKQLIGVTAAEAAAWTDEAAAGLLSSRDVGAYIEWKTRLRARLAHHI